MNEKDKFTKILRVDNVIGKFFERTIVEGDQSYSSEGEILGLISALDPSRLEEFRVLYFALQQTDTVNLNSSITTTELCGPYSVPPISVDEEKLQHRILRSSDIPSQFVPIEERVCRLKTNHVNIAYAVPGFLLLYDSAKMVALNELRRIFKNLHCEDVLPYTVFEGEHSQGLARFAYHNNPADVQQVEDMLSLRVFGKNDFVKQVYDALKAQEWAVLQQINQPGLGLSTKIFRGTAYKFPALDRTHLDNLRIVNGLILP